MFYALSLSVLVAVEEAIDVAFHLCTDEGWGVPASYGESFELLATHGVIDASVAGPLTGARGSPTSNPNDFLWIGSQQSVRSRLLRDDPQRSSPMSAMIVVDKA